MTSVRRALVLEAVPNRQSLLAELLREIGFPIVVEALSPANAAERMSTMAFDILFAEVDNAQPQAALNLVRRLRHDEKTHRPMPVVVITSDSRQSTIDMARDAGASGVLVRPFSRASLLLQVRRIQSGGRARVTSVNYAGPDRRRWSDPDFAGPERRRKDTVFID